MAIVSFNYDIRVLRVCFDIHRALQVMRKINGDLIHLKYIYDSIFPFKLIPYHANSRSLI